MDKLTGALLRKSRDPCYPSKYPLLCPRHHCTHIVAKGKEDTSPTGSGLYQEAAKCHSYQQDTVPQADRQSLTQRRMSLENQAMPQSRLQRPVLSQLGCPAIPACMEVMTPQPKVGIPAPFQPDSWPPKDQAAESWPPLEKPSEPSLGGLPKLITNWAFTRL